MEKREEWKKMYIDVTEVAVRFKQGNSEYQALDRVTLEIEKGEFICLLGPSGCGKSTLLNVMAGFIPPSEGTVKIAGTKVEHPDIQYQTIFQNYGLLPWRTVEKNVELGLETKHVKKEERKQIVKQYLAMVGLEGAQKKRPAQLSGGMQQRVAIARALAVESEVLFMDEPFGALDAITRMRLQDDIHRICKETKKTIIFVTHDIEEAVFLADRIVVMSANPGRIKEIVNLQKLKNRERTSDDFIVARDRIFSLLQMKKEDTVEYYL
ncbi:ABC transporter ATP-binding protein [Anaerosporobacter faecicola]|uniref:ABC transporter ATP-binding protein n=1 Tax=Anaerosporobacter faecicola TaxID=2718714 RepID=UPI002368F1AF|nr:ABC transporter ATP-binding protein [Anaerosporobacter faecicola]